MASSAEVQRLKKIATEVQLLDEHPQEIRCRLCETLVARLAVACIPLMSSHDLRDLEAFVTVQIDARSSHPTTETK